MKVYVGKFRYYYDGDTSVVVATTAERIEQELIKLAQEYAENAVDVEVRLEEMVGNPTTFDEWRQVGWDNEWYELEWERCDLLSDEHILKHVMEAV